MRLAICIALLGSLCGCATPVTRIVHVTERQYLPIPATLTAPCAASDPATIKTNGDLLSAWLADQASIATCDGQLEHIRTLAPPAATR